MKQDDGHASFVMSHAGRQLKHVKELEGAGHDSGGDEARATRSETSEQCGLPGMQLTCDRAPQPVHSTMRSWTATVALEGERAGTPADHLDHALAPLVLACNVHVLLLALRGACDGPLRPAYVGAALGLAALGGLLFRLARSTHAAPGPQYELLHPWWHLAAGAGTWALFASMAR
eukprot:tig00000492_g1407.t1